MSKWLRIRTVCGPCEIEKSSHSRLWLQHQFQSSRRDCLLFQVYNVSCAHAFNYWWSNHSISAESQDISVSLLLHNKTFSKHVFRHMHPDVDSGWCKGFQSYSKKDKRSWQHWFLHIFSKKHWCSLYPRCKSKHFRTRWAASFRDLHLSDLLKLSNIILYYIWVTETSSKQQSLNYIRMQRQI